MSVIDNLITDRTQSDVSRWSQLKAKTLSGMTTEELSEWNAGMKGAYKHTDLNRVNEAMKYLQNRLRGYGYLVDVVLPLIEDVVPGTSRLPDGYQEVEYIQSGGTQHVNTGYRATSEKLRIDVDFESTATNVNKSIYGATELSSSPYNYVCQLYFTQNIMNFMAGSAGNVAQVPYVVNTRYKIQSTLDNGTGTTIVNGQTYTGTYSGQIGKEQWVALLACNIAGNVSQQASVKLYSCQIYDNSVLVRDFVPCKNPSSIVGLYDLVNDTFYGNAGTGSFTAGPDVGTPPTITTRTYWQEGDIPTLSQMEQYLQNVSNIRAVLEVLDTTPQVPADMVGLTVEEANDIERILLDVETVINWVVAGFFRSNAFTVICGNRPLPSAQSDLGRTWDDIDAEDLTWDDLDDHGSSWYTIQYGVLKGTASGIL